MAAAVDMGNQMPGASSNLMFGNPQMWQQQQYMMMQQQAAMSQMMQMQVEHFLQFGISVMIFFCVGVTFLTVTDLSKLL